MYVCAAGLVWLQSFTGSQSFRWFYFFAAMPLLYYTIAMAVGKIFMVVEVRQQTLPCTARMELLPAASSGGEGW